MTERTGEIVRMGNVMRHLTKPVILFDIDWTLLSGNNIHRESFKTAFRTCFDLTSADVSDINPHGLTDIEIIINVARHHNIDPKIIEGKTPEAIKVMEDYFSHESGKEQPQTLPGVEHLLTELQDNEFTLGILSGNLSSIGRSKLCAANIMRYFSLFCYPDTTGNKADSVFYLRDRGLTNTIVLIGDTPNEIRSAKTTNSKSIAVATGAYTIGDLKGLDPGLAVETLEDPSILDYLNNL